MQFADRAFRLLSARLRKRPMPGFIAVCIGVGHQNRRQWSLALFALRNQARRYGCSETDQEGNDHCAAGRAVSDIPTGAAVQ